MIIRLSGNRKNNTVLFLFCYIGAASYLPSSAKRQVDGAEVTVLANNF